MMGALTKRKAFTLVELMVVIAIICLLAALLLPTLKQAREKAKRSVCASNLRQLNIAISLYMNDFNGWPPIRGIGNNCNFSQVGDYTGSGYGASASNLWLYTHNNRLWYCPSFRAKDLVPVHWPYFYSWIDTTTVPTAQCAPYEYEPYYVLALALTGCSSTISDICGRLQVRPGDKWTLYGSSCTYERAFLMVDILADDTGGTYGPGWAADSLFSTAHFDGQRPLGSNGLHGDGSVEWVSYPSANWAATCLSREEPSITFQATH